MDQFNVIRRQDMKSSLTMEQSYQHVFYSYSADSSVVEEDRWNEIGRFAIMMVNILKNKRKEEQEKQQSEKHGFTVTIGSVSEVCPIAHVAIAKSCVRV